MHFLGGKYQGANSLKCWYSKKNWVFYDSRKDAILMNFCSPGKLTCVDKIFPQWHHTERKFRQFFVFVLLKFCGFHSLSAKQWKYRKPHCIQTHFIRMLSFCVVLAFFCIAKEACFLFWGKMPDSQIKTQRKQQIRKQTEKRQMAGLFSTRSSMWPIRGLSLPRGMPWRWLILKCF